jgi:hypothetical protein
MLPHIFHLMCGENLQLENIFREPQLNRGMSIEANIRVSEPNMNQSHYFFMHVGD